MNSPLPLGDDAAQESGNAALRRVVAAGGRVGTAWGGRENAALGCVSAALEREGGFGASGESRRSEAAVGLAPGGRTVSFKT